MISALVRWTRPTDQKLSGDNGLNRTAKESKPLLHYNVREACGDNGQTKSAKESNHNAGAESKHWINRPAGAQGPLPSGIQPQDPTAPPEPWPSPPRRRPGVKDNQLLSTPAAPRAPVPEHFIRAA